MFFALFAAAGTPQSYNGGFAAVLGGKKRSGVRGGDEPAAPPPPLRAAAAAWVVLDIACNLLVASVARCTASMLVKTSAAQARHSV